MFIYSTKLCKLTPFKTPVHSMGNYLQIDSVKSPWETSFIKIGYFKTILHTVNPGLISRPLHHFDSVLILHGRLPWKKLILSGPSYTVNFRFLSRPLWLHTLHSVNGLISRPFRRGKQDRTHSSTVLVTFWTPFKTPHQKSKKTEDTGQLTDHSSSSSHHREECSCPKSTSF